MNSSDFKIDFIGIGVERAGTTWIFECLKEHPQICCSKYKEIKFFSKKTQFSNKNDKYQKGLDFYQSYFSHCKEDQIKGEFSPHYFFEKESALRIKKHFPEVKLILCLRNPIDRAYSFYWFEKTRGKIPYDSFEEAISKEFAYFITEGFYSKPLKNYFSLFPKENILILIYEEIAKDPIKFIQNIYEFLGVDKKFIPRKANQVINTPQTKNKFQLLIAGLILKTKRFLTKFSLGRSLVNQLEKLGFVYLLNLILERRSATYGITPKPPMNPKTRKQLQQLYQKEIKELEKLINKDLSLWN